MTKITGEDRTSASRPRPLQSTAPPSPPVRLGSPSCRRTRRTALRANKQNSPPPRGYDIHTFVERYCVSGGVLTPFGCDSAWGGGNGDDAGALWRCSPGKRGAFFHARLVANGGKGVSVRRLGNGRAGEMRITRFLHNPDVTVEEMVSTASARTCTLVRGRHVLAIQDTTTVRVDKEGCGLSLHPVIA